MAASPSPLLRALEALPHTQTPHGAVVLREGVLPAARVHDLQRRLPGLTRGEGVLECEWDSYRPVRGTIPTRPRAGASPLNRKDYLLQITRRTERGGGAV